MDAPYAAVTRSVLVRAIVKYVSWKETEVKIALVGGVFHDRLGALPRSRTTPETILLDGLLSRGHEVQVFGHAAFSPNVAADVVHVHHLGLGALAMASSGERKPFVFTSHNGQIHSGFETSATHRHALRFVLSRADAVVALTDAEASFLKPHMASGAMCRVIPNGVDGSRFFPNDTRSVDTGHVTILFVGQLIPVKGVEYLIDALALLRHNPAWRLRMVYHNDMLLRSIRERAERQGLLQRIDFLGSVPSPEMGGIYRDADMLVLPSLGEALPSVITESFLSGVPVVSTAVTGLHEQVGEFGILCRPADAQSLARGIEEMMLRLDSFRHMKDQMRAYAQGRFGVNGMVESHLRLYEFLASQGRRSGSRTISDAFVGVATKAYRFARSWGLPPV